MSDNPWGDAEKLVNRIFNDNSVIFHDNFSAIMLGNIAQDTPQDEGFAKANWDAGYDDNIAPTRNKDLTLTGLRARRKAQSQLTGGSDKADGRVNYIKNGVLDEEGTGGYIIELEEGKSPKAPVGMVLLNIAFSQSVAKKAMKLK